MSCWESSAWSFVKTLSHRPCCCLLRKGLPETEKTADAVSASYHIRRAQKLVRSTLLLFEYICANELSWCWELCNQILQGFAWSAWKPWQCSRNSHTHKICIICLGTIAMLPQFLQTPKLASRILYPVLSTGSDESTLGLPYQSVAHGRNRSCMNWCSVLRHAARTPLTW